jgi:hypothetical protein
MWSVVEWRYCPTSTSSTTPQNWCPMCLLSLEELLLIRDYYNMLEIQSHISLFFKYRRYFKLMGLRYRVLSVLNSLDGSLRHCWVNVMLWVGYLTEENFCVLNEISHALILTAIVSIFDNLIFTIAKSMTLNNVRLWFKRNIEQCHWFKRNIKQCHWFKRNIKQCQTLV